MLIPQGPHAGPDWQDIHRRSHRKATGGSDGIRAGYLPASAQALLM